MAASYSRGPCYSGRTFIARRCDYDPGYAILGCSQDGEAAWGPPARLLVWAAESPFLGDNQSGAAAKCQIRPDPLQHDQQAVLETGQIVNVHRQSHHPGEESGKLELSDFHHRPAAADRRHLAFVDEMKRLSRSAGEVVANQLRQVLTLLHGDRRRAGQRFPSLMRKARQIARGEDLRMALDT